MAVADLNNGTTDEIITGRDNIVIVDNFQSVRGGRTLVVGNYPLRSIRAGHVIIKETATQEYKPMPITDDGSSTNTFEYDDLPGGHEYAGILIASIPTNRPFAGIMLRGTVNFKATEFDMSDILDAVKSALPLIIFTEDRA